MRSAVREAALIVSPKLDRKGGSMLSKAKAWFTTSAYVPPVTAFVVLFLLWELAVRLFHIQPVTLPAPSSVLYEFVSSLTFYLPHAWVTLYEALAGFFLGMTVAIIGGIYMAHSPLLERTLLPIAVLANVTPIMAIAPLFILWFGFDALPKILIAAIITFFPMLVNSITGFRSIDDNHLEYMKSLHASKREIFFKLRVPNSLPYLFSAARTCVSLSVMGAVVGEWSGSTQGLGNVIMMSSNYMQTERMFSAIFILAMMGILLTNIVRLLERKVLYWHVSSSDRT
ncbi:ABC transporter permease [Paenibacillus sp. SYP-B4298]|uniref:ABC transporter permease n=1 Tax=Paenibacillus sp. SYP-B4298 TaxID=2996034 RepID=UPI0022DD3199|nr:ABC transporter permease [Paenibacillus sp. SYP-B4298]